jgi:hypothetical protein
LWNEIKKENIQMKLYTKNSMSCASLLGAVMLIGAMGALISCTSSQKPETKANYAEQTTFATPEAAGQALQTASKAKDEASLSRILGPNSKAILSSGDPAEDAAALDSFVANYERMNRWVTMTDGNRVLYIGAENYPFPIPLTVNSSSKWYFNTKAGEEEILARRIGRNELLAMDACSAIANAEEIYFKQAHAANPAHHYTAILISGPGKQDGLYWDVPQGTDSSPLGKLADFAKDAISSSSSESKVFDGYSFRVLTAQGNQAMGGAKSYIVNGKMTGGFAIVATPIKYQDSGIMTFILSREGVVYERDLGAKTTEVASAIQEYNPTKEWEPAQ